MNRIVEGLLTETTFYVEIHGSGNGKLLYKGRVSAPDSEAAVHELIKAKMGKGFSFSPSSWHSTNGEIVRDIDGVENPVLAVRWAAERV